MSQTACGPRRHDLQGGCEDAPPPVNGAYRPGKQALEKRHRGCVSCEDPQRLTGSIDLDSALTQEPDYANARRWDYGLGYRPVNGPEQAVWVEVHSATTKEVSSVLRKLEWLRDWLNGNAEALRRMTDAAGEDVRFVWIASSGVHIPWNSPKARQLKLSRIRKVRPRLSLP